MVDPLREGPGVDPLHYFKYPFSAGVSAICGPLMVLRFSFGQNLAAALPGAQSWCEPLEGGVEVRGMRGARLQLEGAVVGQRVQNRRGPHKQKNRLRRHHG